MATSVEHDARSVSGLVRELRDETTTLLRQEVALAKTEMSEKLSKVTRNAIYLIVGGAIAHLGLIFLLLAVTGGLEVMFIDAGMVATSQWLSPLLVGVVIGVIGAALLFKAKSSLSTTTVVPEKTVQTLQEDKQWIQNKVQ